MVKKQVHLLVIVILLTVLSCNLPGVSLVASTPPGEGNDDLIATITALAGLQQNPQSPANTPAPSPTAIVTADILITATSCAPMITVNSDANVRSGPGTVYDPPVGTLSAGATANVEGKDSTGTWWYIVYPPGSGGHAWISGSLVTPSCLPSTVAIIPAPPTPLPPSGSCKGDYIWRLIRPSDKICVSPASKAQADADNAAANSRKAVNVYGMDVCISGYVWREAYSGDVVCVTAAVRSQAAADNAAAASRWVVGAYGPHTCIAGFVWREARPGDDVCVTGEVRTQTANDNAAAASRKAVNVYGLDACISGYVWREAFSGDMVCVTSAVRTQVQADNAAAPSHTWP
jgi:hypothetical protein